MASTKEKKKKKVVEQVVEVEKKEEVQDVSPVKKDVLDPVHLLQIETMSRDILLAKANMHLMEQELRNMVLEHTILANKIEKQKALCKEKDRMYSAEVAKFESFKKEIWPEYGFAVTEGLAYEPLSGKIVKD